MIVCKKDLGFLKVFQSCSNTADFSSDKLVIIKEGDTASFMLRTPDVKLVQKIGVNAGEADFGIALNLSKFVSMLSFCSPDEEVSITKAETKFGRNSNYNFESFQFDENEYKQFKDMTTEGKVIEITNLDKLANVDSFMGTDKETACIAIQDNHFITYNGYVLGITKTENNIDENFYLSKDFYTLYRLFKFNSISLTKLDGKPFYYFYHSGMAVFLSITEYSIPYIFDAGVQAKFNHPAYIEYDRDEFKNALSRIKILSQDNAYARIYIYFSDDKTKIEVKDDYVGYEDVNSLGKTAEFNTEYIICNSIQLYAIIQSMKESYFRIYCDTEGARTIKIESDGTTKYVLTLYKKLEQE